MEYLINIVLLALLAVTAGAVVRLRNLFAAVMLAGIYSLLTAAVFVILDAVDVAFTEAAVGAGIATILMLAALALTGREQSAVDRSERSRPRRRPRYRRGARVGHARHAALR